MATEGIGIFCLGLTLYGFDWVFYFACETTVTYTTGVPGLLGLPYIHP